MQSITPCTDLARGTKVALVIFCCIFSYLDLSYAQTTYKFNAQADLELSKAGEKSDYYYNEIDRDNIDYRFGFSQLNLIGQMAPDSNWIFNVRLLMERSRGRKLSKVSIPQLNVQWVSNNRKTGFTLGLLANPFGSFNKNQLSTKRNFIGLPLAYSYYANISSVIGYLPDMGDVTLVPIDDELQWGSTNLYYGGYTAGAMFSWNIKPSKINWKIALVNGASNKVDRFTKPINLGVISRLKLQPTYYWEQGVSVSHGSFMKESEVSAQLEGLGMFTQTLLGTDFKFGKGFIELSGEIIGAFYKVPRFNSDNNTFETTKDTDALTVNNLSAYLDIKYEFPKIPGSYLAYRIDHLRFGKVDNTIAQHWDNNVLRHSFAVGYHINQHILARVAVSTQQVDNKPWDKKQGTFRLVFTAHY